MKIALVVGHSRTSQGAVNHDSGLTEFAFNKDLVLQLRTALIAKDINVSVVYRTTYKKLPNKINKVGADYIISFHCNAFNKKATGSEVLYYYKSTKGKVIAKKLKEAIVKTLGLTDRGIKGKSASDRGGYVLKYTNAPCVILEPFFIDNNDDLKVAKEKEQALVKAYAEAIATFE